MLINHRALLACRAHLFATPPIVTTGITSLAAVGSTYVRTAGSFIDDGFTVGQEVTTSLGFPVPQPPGTVLAVSPLVLTLHSARVASAATSPRTIVVGIPSSRQYVNVPFTPVAGVPYIAEAYVPAGSARTTYGGKGRGMLVEDFMYVITWFGIAGKGAGAIMTPLDRVREWFAVDTELTDGVNTIRVTGAPAPFLDEIVEQPNGFARALLTIPCSAHTRL